MSLDTGKIALKIPFKWAYIIPKNKKQFMSL